MDRQGDEEKSPRGQRDQRSSSWRAITPEPSDKLRKEIQDQRVVLPLAQYLWNKGWKKRYKGTVLTWQDFLRIVSSKYYRFQGWASKEKPWVEVEKQLDADCRRRVKEKVASFLK